MSTAAAPPKMRPKDFLGIDRLLSDQERDIHDTVRAFVAEQIVPEVGEWFEAAEIPYADSLRRWASWGSWACTSPATAARAPRPPPTAWPVWS